LENYFGLVKAMRIRYWSSVLLICCAITGVGSPVNSDSLLHEAELYDLNGNYDDELHILFYLDSISVAENDYDLKVKVELRKAELFRGIRNYQLAISTLDKLNGFVKDNDSRSRLESLSLRAGIMLELKYPDSVRTICNKILSEPSNSDFYLGKKGDALILLGVVEKEQNPDKAIHLLNRALSIFEKLGNESRMGLVYFNLGGAYYEIGDMDNALKYARELEAIGAKNNLHGFLRSSKNMQRRVYLKMENIQGLYRVSVELDSLYQFNFDAKGKAEKELYKRAQELQQQEISLLNDVVKQMSGWVTISIVVAIILLLVVVFLMWRNNVEHNKNLKVKEELIQTKDKILSVISHDLRSPFAHMLTFLAFGDEGLTQEEKKQINEEQYNSTQNALFMLDNLLFWAHSQSNGMHVSSKLINLKHSIQNLVEQANSGKHLKDIEIINKCEASTVSIDENILHIILRNFLSNAVKYSPKGSKVFVDCESTEKSLTIRVVDEGVGMPQSVIDLLESNIGSIESERGTENEKGAGLGLKLCIEFAASIGATLKFKRNPEKGTTAMLVVPIKG
tara:strand:- start:12209 stop:13903 length:1695 start_codon:yes stop_codon:yes gene_type:complete